MYRVGLCLFISVVVLVNTVSLAAASNPVNSMAEQSEQFFKHTKAEAWPEAREALWQLTTSFSEYNWEDMDVTVEGIHALSEALIQAKSTLTKTDLQAHEVHMQAIQVRLGIDALQNREQPLWHRYYKVIKKDVAQLREVVPSGDKQAIQQALDRLHAHYRLIEPALYVARTAEVVEQVRSLFVFMENQIHDVSINHRQLQEGVDQWEKLLDPLFYGSDEDVMAVVGTPDYPITYTTWFLAILIGTVLTYVTWKKAQAEQSRRFGSRF